jgi:pSer/pThr/pTyr-binding forkhead associated (FHA) protein
MAKLVLSERGALVTQCFVDAEPVTIGREPTNQIVVDDPEVSREHAAVLPVGRDHILEDRGSANGTFVNGARVERRILKHGDVIALGRFNLRYLNPRATGSVDLERTMLISGLERTAKDEPSGGTLLPAVRAVRVAFPSGRATIESGPGEGDTVELERVVAIFGAPGRESMVIARRPHGYFVTSVEGAPPRVNGRAIGRGAHPLASGDRIECGGQRIRFQQDS